MTVGTMLPAPVASLLSTEGLTTTNSATFISCSPSPVSCVSRVQTMYAFHLQYVAEQEEQFQKLATPHGTFHAFHGSSVERFHSILHNGLLNMFNEVHESTSV